MAANALAVMSPQRNPAVPGVPAIGEIIPGLEFSAGTGIGAPAATPTGIIERLNRDINACLRNPGLKARYADVGAVPLIFTPAEARAKDSSPPVELVEKRGPIWIYENRGQGSGVRGQ